MKKELLYGIIAVVVGILIYTISSYSSFNQSTTPAPTPTVTRGNCLADDCLLVDGMEYPAGTLPQDVKAALDAALDDEYKAFVTYQTIITKLGNIRPFAMIIGAEEQHIASLKAIYAKYGETPKSNPYIGKLTSPATLSAACSAGVEAEIANADLYQKNLLPKVASYSDITVVFTNLMNASQSKHLPAFELCSSR